MDTTNGDTVYVWDLRHLHPTGKVAIYVKHRYKEDGTGYDRSESASAALTPDEVRGLIVQLQCALAVVP